MELIYYWIYDDNCIHEQGFCFSPEYNISMSKSSPEKYELKISSNIAYNVFSSDVISNITVLVGDNGAGKSTLLKNLLTLNCYPYDKENDPRYHALAEDDYKHNMNLIILKDNNQLSLYTNINKCNIDVPEVFTENKNLFYVNNNPDIVQYNILNNQAYRGFTKIYISNSYFDNISGMGSSETLDELVITPASLTSISNTFFEFIFPETTSLHNNFDLYSKLLKKNKNPKEFQQICDLLFYSFLITTDFINTYEGFIQTNLQINVQSVYSIISKVNIENTELLDSIKTILTDLEKKFDHNKIKMDIIYVLKINYIFEWCLKNNGELLKSDFSLEEIFSKIISSEKKASESSYFSEALTEINDFSKLMNKIPSIKNLVPVADYAYKSGKEIKKISKDSLPKSSDWKDFITYIDKRARVNKDLYDGKRSYGSFLLRYLRISNLIFSSGERVFQNLMSWMYFLSQLDIYTTQIQHHTRKDLLVCLDEIDLSLHPAWQRDFIDYFVMLINQCYKGRKIQVVMTTHSPLFLSNFPKGNIIYLQKTEDGTKVDNTVHKETFGANLYEILNDTFYLGNNSMGKFAMKYIQDIIKDINEASVMTKESFYTYKIKIECIGDSLIKNKLNDKLLKKFKNTAKKTEILNALDEKIKQLEIQKRKIMEKDI